MPKTYSIGLLVLCTSLLYGCASSDAASYAQAKQNFEQQNYELAYQQVLVPAQKGNAQAQYALGYMYYYGKGTVMNQSMGKYWIRKAAEAGDTNAIQAFQLISGQDQNIMQPANATPALVPTTATPDETAPTAPVSTPTQVKLTNTTVKKATVSHTAAETDILKTPSHHYALQLLDASSPEEAADFIAAHRFGSNASYFHRTLNGKDLYVVVYGNYASQATAERALRQLPPSLHSLKPWVRSYGSMQAEIKNNATR